MDVTSLGFRTDIALLTASGSEVEDRGTHLIVRTPENPTYFWGNFLLLASPPVPGGEREVIGAFRTEFPDANHVSIGIDQQDLSDATQAAFVDAGLGVEGAVALTASSLVQPLAPMVAYDIRALDSDDDWQARARLAHSLTPKVPARDFMPYAAARNVQERRLVDAGLGQRFGAFVEGELVSTAAIFRTDSDLARYQSVETHADHRRQGLGAVIVHAAGQYALTDLGVTTLLIVADEDGEGIGLYRRLGFSDTERQWCLEGRSPQL